MPVASSPYRRGVVLLSALASATRSRTSTRCSAALLEAGVLALLLALVVGYGAGVSVRAPDQAARGGGRADRRRPASTSRSSTGARTSSGSSRAPSTGCACASSQLERARREFIGNASHELRTPLFSLRGFLELLTDEELDEATRREFLETMREQVDRLQRLAEDLLDLTRLDAGRMHIERQRVDLARGRRGSLRRVPRGRGRDRRTRSSSRRRRRAALGDEERILRIGRALVENALKHTPPGTRVVGALDRQRRSPSRTTGRASRAEHAGHVFDRFYRVDGAQASGSGLGLAIAQELAEAMGGTLELESATAGRPSFTLRLPPALRRVPRPFPRENGYPRG